MIVHHASAAPLDHAALVVGGSRGRGPSALGLWTCATVRGWQRSYGPVLNRIEIHADAETLRTTSRALSDMAGSGEAQAWASLGAELLSSGVQVVVLEAEGEEGEVVVLDPMAIRSVATVEWPA